MMSFASTELPQNGVFTHFAPHFATIRPEKALGQRYESKNSRFFSALETISQARRLGTGYQKGALKQPANSKYEV
jgi:hypothetical protein